MTLAEDRNINLVSVCRLTGVRNQIGFRQVEGESIEYKAHGSRVDFLLKKLSQKPHPMISV